MLKIPRQDAVKRGAAAALLSSLLLSTAAIAAPPIRTDSGNKVPECVSPDRLMAFIRDRNNSLDPRYADIARWYKHYGESWHVRWDYAFYQMILETNYLKFRRGDGSRGDVHEKQNNFAGIGATGGGVAGERFGDIKTGVHAQIQHLVAYSGEPVADPVAKRTRENQDDIIAKSKRLGRAVTFGDLARRWAADRQYAKNIDTVAGMFRDGYCHGPALAADVTPPSPVPARRFAKPAGLGGPKPQMLAGPETLPWDDAGNSIAQASPSPQTDSEATSQDSPAAPEQKRPGPPVRTIWSRKNGTSPAPAHLPEQPQAQQPALPQQRAETRGRQPEMTAAPAHSEQAAPAGTTVPASSPSMQAQESEALELPTFRIAPRTAEPSRLGGPVVTTTTGAIRSGSRNLPAGTFVENDPPPMGLPPSEPAYQPAAVAALPAPTARASAPARTPTDSAQGGTTTCHVNSVSFGGQKTLLVQSDKSGVRQLTALTVLEGFEKSMLESYAKVNAPDAKMVGSFASKTEALEQAKALCPKG